MARNVTSTELDIQPVEHADGTLKGLTIQRIARTTRKSSDGRSLGVDRRQEVGEPMEIPAYAIADLAQKLADWTVYYATGQAAADAR